MNMFELVSAFTPALQRFAQTDANTFEMDVFRAPEGNHAGGKVGRIIASRDSREVVVRFIKDAE